VDSFTLVAHLSVRNQLIEQEWNLVKAYSSRLTMHPVVTLALISMLVFWTNTEQSLGQSTSHPYMSQSANSMQQMLQAPCEQVLENVSLEALIDSISGAYDIPIWCDRRIAKDTLVTLEKREESLESFLNRAVVKANAVLIPLAGVLMICPRSRSDEIEAAHWRLAVSRSASSMRPLGAKSFGWPDGYVASAAIRDFVTRCMPEANLNIKIERDIWRTFEFPKSTTPATVSVCLLSGFDQCLADQDGTLAITPIASTDAKVEWTYTMEDIKKIGELAWKSWRDRWPEATFMKSAKPAGWRVIATVASHRDLIAPLIPKKKWEKPKPSEVGLDRKAYSATFENEELERVIRSLAASTKIEFYPMPLPASLESKKVNLKLVKTPLDEILKELTKQCGVRFKRDGQRVEIIP